MARTGGHDFYPGLRPRHGGGRSALEARERWDHELVLMDIQMPVMDGMAATRAIRTAEAASGRKQ